MCIARPFSAEHRSAISVMFTRLRMRERELLQSGQKFAIWAFGVLIFWANTELGMECLPANRDQMLNFHLSSSSIENSPRHQRNGANPIHILPLNRILSHVGGSKTNLENILFSWLRPVSYYNRSSSVTLNILPQRRILLVFNIFLEGETFPLFIVS